ncbi:unnamed protein product [Adineta steineri]|uniref:Protein NO VEIN C-terminal domain-containing protein n=2 Tax=Adineta steineri TaxID=433720 RepID=A0A813TFM9_9BILA|nr:unnamed protein product [Adineta steineri]
MATQETSLKRYIEELSTTNTDYKFPQQAINQAESLKSLSSDLYTDNIRFIYELIQNADDAAAKHATLAILNKKYLIIAHDGKPFDEKDLRGLCGINNGTKKKDLDKTGYKGLGFKAVFGKSNNVIIYSNGEYFRFNSSYRIKWNEQWGTENQEIWEKENDRQFIYPWQINPIWTNEDEIPTFIIDFFRSSKIPVHVANIILLNNAAEICQAIEQLKQQPHMFLFLRHISQMAFRTETSDIVSIECDANHGSKKIYYNQKIHSQWIIKRLELGVPKLIRQNLIADCKVPDKLRGIKKAEMLFAAKYKDSIIDENGKITHTSTIDRLQDKESHLFSYLPTKIVDYTFPILINANFLTNANREQIHTDSSWNQWLFQKIGSEIFKWIKELVRNDQFRFEAYRLIPIKLNLTNNCLSEQFDKSFDKAVKDCDFILDREDKNQLRVDEVIMDLTSLSRQSSFISTNSMRQYVINHYKKSTFQCAEQPFIDFDSNLYRLGVRQFNWQNCIEMFKTDEFLRTHSIEQNKLMIGYFYSKLSKGEVADDIGIKIEQIPFLMDQNNRLQTIKNIYFPGETFGDGETSYSFVNIKIFKWLNEDKHQDIKQWLQTLGVIERTDLTYLYKTIIPNASTYITSENAMKTIKMLFVLFQNNLIVKKELDQLRQLKLLTTQGNFISAERCFFSDEFKPRLTLEEYLKTKEDIFLSFNYVTKDILKNKNESVAEWRRFFSMLGVRDELHIVEFPQKLTIDEAAQHGFCLKYLLKKFEVYHTIEAYSGIKTITFLNYTKDDYEFSKYFWSYVIKNIKVNDFEQNTKIYWGHSYMSGAINGTQIKYPNYIEWFIKNNTCIPTTLNTCELSSNVFVDDQEIKEFCNQYMPFPSISISPDNSDWSRFLNFKPKPLLIDYLNLFEKFRQDENNSKDCLNRIQMIYSYILKHIALYTESEAKTINSQARKIYLLGENNQWKLAKDLYVYVESKGEHSNLNDAVPCLKLNLKNKTHPNLKKFLDLFQINSIKLNDLHLQDEKSTPAEQFREKLIEISPYLKQWLKLFDYSSDDISSIDKILQQDIHFKESDYLKLFYKEKFIQETNVYHNINNQHLYVTRPWHGETTLIDLPNRLCQLLNIQGFEDKLRFLLKAQKDEIIKHFKKFSIEVPTHKDIVRLQMPSKSDSSSLFIKQSNDENLIPIEEIDVSDMITPNLESMQNHSHGKGYYGEQMVYRYLQKKYSSKPGVSVKWLNQDDESHFPHDIELIKDKKQYYIEVKSTEINDNHMFQLSFSQIAAILEHNTYYSIYRVYINAKKLCVLNNIRQRLNKEELSCTMTINIR